MSRSLTNTAIGAAFASETAEIPLMLIEIVHADITTLRYVNNTANVTSNGDLYTAYPFMINIPPVDSSDEIPRSQLSLDNVDLISQTLRGLSSAPTVKAALILSSAPDDLVLDWYEFSLKDIQYNATVVSGTLGFEDILNESFPAGRF